MTLLGVSPTSIGGISLAVRRIPLCLLFLLCYGYYFCCAMVIFVVLWLLFLLCYGYFCCAMAHFFSPERFFPLRLSMLRQRIWSYATSISAA